MATLISGTPGGQRTFLADVLPLQTPFLIQIFPFYGCNLHCEYCLHSLPLMKRGNISQEKMMSWDLYKKCIDDIGAFPGKVKMLRFAGIGEPLLHKDISRMVQYAVACKVVERVDIVTNGLALNYELTDELVNSGLSMLRISINGLSSEEYLKHTGVSIDFDSFIDQIKYFYLHRGTTKVYIKIIDYLLQKPGNKQKFFEIFNNMCDEIAIECLTPSVQDFNMDKNVRTNELSKTQGNTPIIETNICPQPFYMMQINPDGMIVPCCSMEYPDYIGNASEMSVVDIWNSKKFNVFRFNMLSGVEQVNNVCKKCSLYQYGIYKEDILDEKAEALKEKYKVDK